MRLTRNMRKLLLKVAIFFIFSITIHDITFAQYIGLDPETPITQYTLKSWTIDNGLPSNAIINIIQSQDGYIWIASYGGVARFDGLSFTIYKSRINNALYTEAAKIVCEDKDGIIWIGTQRGITLIKDDNIYRDKKLKILDELNIESIFVDKKNCVWIGTNVNGLFKYENDSLIHLDKLNNFTTNSIYSIFEDNNENIWIGTINGELLKFRDNVFTPCDMHNSSEEIFSFYQDRENIIWVATSNGVYTIVNDKLQKHPNFNIRFVINIIEDVNGYLWISTSVDGLYRFNKYTFQKEHLSEINGLPNNRVQKIIFDKQGNLWGGTYRNGLFQITDNKFICFSKSEGLYSELNTAILQYDENEFWVANEKGTIDIIKNGQASPLKTKISALSPRIKHMLKDSKGNVWISTYAGLLKIAGHKEKLYDMDNGFPDNYIRKTFEDSDGNIWVATNRTGIHIIKADGSIFTINSSNGLSSNYVMTIIRYKPGIIIAGTKKGIDFIKNDSVIKQYTMASGLPDNMIFNIYKDKEDILWISTNTGISRFENNSFTNYNVESGLKTNNVFDIIEDNFGYFWMPGPTGIMKVSKKQLNDYADGKINKIDCLFYDKSDGLKSPVCLGATESLKDTKGNIWFLTAEGIAQIDPKKTDASNELPPVFIEKVYTSDSSFNLNTSINIRPKYNRFNIKYTAIDLVFPEKILFKYKLEPFEKDWIDAEHKRAVSYTNIDPGNYTFKLRSTNNNGIWNENYVSIKIKVLPAWYQTFLFKIALFVFIISGIIFWNNLRINRIKKQRNILEKLVKERTLEILQQKEEISIQAEHLENINHELEKLSIVASETDNGVIIANDKGKIEWINEGFTKMFGHNLQELIQNKGDSLINSSNNINIKTHYNKCIKEKKSVVYSSLNVTKSGKEIWVQTTLTPVLDNNGNINKLLAIDSDITKIKEAENKIKEQNDEILAQSEDLQAANDKLIELDQFKEELTGMIIHDLKNPLNAIIGLAESDIVKQSGKQMLNMIMNILDVNKFENTEIKIQTSNTSIYEVSKLALSQVDLLYQQKNIQLINHIQNFYVDIDPEIIERVFINLLTNAIKYTPNNGTITLKSEEYSPNFIRIKVSDTGQGIPQEKMHKVFGKFEQVIARDSGLTRSTGIGLTFCKLFVEAHGGEIGVESEENKGSTFWFTLPIGNQGNEEIIIEEEIIEEKPIDLTQSERKLLKPFLLKLQKLEVYESTEVEKIIEQIDCSKTQNLQKWKAEMDNAMEALNEEKYKKLIHLIDE